jgi:hypothetical protein
MYYRMYRKLASSQSQMSWDPLLSAVDWTNLNARHSFGPTREPFALFLAAPNPFADLSHSPNPTNSAELSLPFPTSNPFVKETARYLSITINPTWIIIDMKWIN